MLQLIGYGRQEGGSQAAIHDAVIVGEGQVHHVTDADGVAFCRLQDYRSLLNSADGQYGYLWLIDNGSAHQASESADIGHGESASLGIFGSKLAIPGIVCQGIYLPG